MDTIFKIGILLAVFITVGLFVFFGAQFISMQQKALLNEAQYQCALSVRYEVQEGENATISYPPEHLYEECLAEKNQ